MGGVHGDGMRRLQGSLAHTRSTGGNQTTGLLSWGGTTNKFVVSQEGDGAHNMYFDSSRVAPTAAKTQPRAWGALACCHLGQRAS